MYVYVCTPPPRVCSIIAHVYVRCYFLSCLVKRFCFVQPDAGFVREKRRKEAEVAIVTKINPTGAARTEVRTQAVIANLVGRSSRTLLRSADSILEESAAASSLDGNNVIIRGEKRFKQGRRSGAGGGSNSINVMGDGHSILSGTTCVATTVVDDENGDYSDINGNSALSESIIYLQAIYRVYKMKDNGGGMCSVRRSKIHGWGLFAMKDFDCGDILVEYMGEVIRQCIADRRERKVSVFPFSPPPPPPCFYF